MTDIPMVIAFQGQVLRLTLDEAQTLKALLVSAITAAQTAPAEWEDGRYDCVPREKVDWDADRFKGLGES